MLLASPLKAFITNRIGDFGFLVGRIRARQIHPQQLTVAVKAAGFARLPGDSRLAFGHFVVDHLDEVGKQLGQVDILVAREDADAARELLADAERGELALDDSVDP